MARLLYSSTAAVAPPGTTVEILTAPPGAVVPGRPGVLLADIEALDGRPLKGLLSTTPTGALPNFFGPEGDVATLYALLPGGTTVTLSLSADGGGGSGTSSPLVDAVLTGDVTLNGEPLGVLLKGDSAPRDERVLDPIVGDWGWSEQSAAWFGPAYAVSWQVGDNVGQVTYIPGSGSGAVQPSVLVGAGPFDSDQPATGIPQYDWNFNDPPEGVVHTATVAGSGIVFILQEEEGFGGPTTPPRPDLDVLDYLGDLVLTNGTTPIAWAPDRGDGYDGDYFLLKQGARSLYGPKTAGAWGSPVMLNVPTDGLDVSATADAPLLNGYGFTGGAADLVHLVDGGIPSAVAFRVTAHGAPVTAAAAAPADGALVAGEVAMWFDPTAGTPVVNFKGKDADGDVFTATVPLS